MKMLAEYLEKAISFERMASAETDPKLRADLEQQGRAYRQLATERARQIELPGRSPTRTTTEGQDGSNPRRIC